MAFVRTLHRMVIKMAQNDVWVGTWTEIPTAYVTNVVSKAGLDFTIADMEHGILTFETIQSMVFAAHSENKKIFVRVPAIDEVWVLRALDTGCDGIVFPQVTCADMVKDIIRLSFFPPQGCRGFNPYVAAGGYTGAGQQMVAKENARIAIIVILEGKEILEQIEEILSYPEVDVIYIGQYDLSADLGIPGDVNNQKVVQIMKEAVCKIRSAGKRAGCMGQGVSDAIEYINMGFNFITYKVDTGVLFESMHSFVRGVKNEII